MLESTIILWEEAANEAFRVFASSIHASNCQDSAINIITDAFQDSLSKLMLKNKSKTENSEGPSL